MNSAETDAPRRLASRSVMVLLTAAIAAAAAFMPGTVSAGDPPDGGEEMETVYWDAPDETGRLHGGRVHMPRATIPTTAVAAPFTTILDNGPPWNRIDIVTVGDGYASGELGSYADHVDNALLALFSDEPFVTYRSFFNVHRVEVVSPESGVDNDPVQGILRDTAMDMEFWCSDIERLLCVDVGLAFAFAGAAPDVDQVLAVANSTKYGGAGYPSSEMATFSGGNGSATEVAIHELGHSLGDLADEYHYADGETYDGPERPERNVSILTAAEMSSAGTKWAAWLGASMSGYDGTVSTYEGAHYHQFGIYRPSSNSKMRSLGRPFNLPSAEALILQFYRIVSPIDDALPTNEVLAGDETVWVIPVEPVGHPLDVQWFLEGEPIPGATGTTLDLAALEPDPGLHALKVTVIDNTPIVRDEAARSQWLYDGRTWTVEVEPAGGGADLDGDGIVGFLDLVIVIGNWGACAPPPAECPADVDGDGAVGFSDLQAVLSNWS